MSYTKGPWKVMKVKTQVGKAFKITEIDKGDLVHGLIACIYDDNTSLNERPHDEHEANARLISSAPELLEALKAVRTLLLQNRALGLCQGTEYVYIVDKVEQAISKAEL